MTKKQSAAQVLAHKRALKAAQMKRYRDRQRQEDGLERFSLLHADDGMWYVYEGSVRTGFAFSSRAVALEVAAGLEANEMDIVPMRKRAVR